MTTPFRIDPEILGRVLAGNGSTAERELVAEFVRAHPEVDVLMAHALDVNDGLQDGAREEARERFAAHLGMPRTELRFWGDADHRPSPVSASGVHARTTRPGYRVSQTLGGGIAGLGTRTLRRLLPAGVLTAITAAIILLAHRTSPQPSVSVRVYATNAQQQATINLNDDSRIILAPQSTLRMEYAGAKLRVVQLQAGEAYFEVSHNPRLPFVVRSGVATAQILGTAFLVRHVRGDPHVRVAVIDGKVRVTIPGRAEIGMTLTAGQVGDVTDSTTQVSTVDNLPPTTEWFPGRIVFHHTPVATVLQAVSHWYGYHFQYMDSTLNTRKVTMQVSMRSSAEALADLEQVLEMNLAVRGDTVTLVPQSSHPNRSAPRIRTYDVWTPSREVGR